MALSHATTEWMLEHDPYSDDTSGIFGSIAKAVGGAAKGVAKGVSGAAKSAIKATDAVGGALSKVPVVGGALKGLATVTVSPFSAATHILAGERIDKAVIGDLKRQVGAAKNIAPYVQSVISFVPGIGTGISGAISGGLALAEGKPITEAVLEAAKGALPGGPLAKAAFDVAAAAAQGKSISDVALAAVPLPPAQKDILRQTLAVAKDIANGKKIDKILLNRVNDNLSKLPKSVQTAAQVGIALGQGKNIQSTMLKAAGTVASGTNTMNLLTKAASNLGVTKAGIEKAVGAAQAIKNGSPVLKSSLAKAVSSYAANSPGHLGFKTAVAVLKNTAGNKAAMGVARRALPNEAARQGFDAAVGVVAKTVSQNPGGLAKRAGSSFVANLSKPKGVMSPYQPNLKHAIESMTRNPTLVMQHPMVLANKFGTSQQTVLQALKHVGTQRLMPWRSLSPNAANFIRKWNPNANVGMLTHGTNDTAGLDESGTKYIVEKGDSPFKIAQKLTGNGNRWTELKALNADKKPAITVNVWVGEVLNLPASWQKPTVKQSSPGPAVSSQPAPQAPVASVPVAATISVAPGILQGKGILVAWGKTDGIKEAGVSNYGATAEDLSTNFGPRDSLQLKSYQNWNNKTSAAKLVVDGKLGPKSLASLQAWAEKRATQAIPASPVQVSVPGGAVTTLPEIVIEGSVPRPSPVLTVTPPVVVTSPGIPQIPQLPVAVSVPSAPTPSSAPVVVAAPSHSATAQPKSAGSSMGPALAGAAIGGTLFGLPGAIIGGVAGAAMA